MFLTAFNYQLGMDGQGMFLIGRMPTPTWRLPLPGRLSDPLAAERGFLHRYRAFLVDELEDARQRIGVLQGRAS